MFGDSRSGSHSRLSDSWTPALDLDGVEGRRLVTSRDVCGQRQSSIGAPPIGGSGGCFGSGGSGFFLGFDAFGVRGGFESDG